jgi:hypothetical protein
MISPQNSLASLSNQAELPLCCREKEVGAQLRHLAIQNAIGLNHVVDTAGNKIRAVSPGATLYLLSQSFSSADN